MGPPSKSFFQLLATYDRPAPRYTSYPTVPYWSDPPSAEEWLQYAGRALQAEDATVGIYIHIPFCEKLCSFCACNSYITQDHSLGRPYIASIHRELQLYLDRLPLLAKRELAALHLGGGTPNFLQADDLRSLLKPFADRWPLAPRREFSAELDPRHLDIEQLEALRAAGFDRLSFGIQDFSAPVQRIIGRLQSIEDSSRIYYQARQLGFGSINFDLIYGLPLQTAASLEKSIEAVLRLLPDRIALYSYAHVPWIQEAQRVFTESSLPRGAAKYHLYELARRAFEGAGYQEIGMDHFALPGDPLWEAHSNGRLHRNFMGYSAEPASLLLGLGSSAISDSGDCYHQNEKALMKYQKRIDENHIPTLRGHKLTDEDRRRRQLILSLATSWQAELPKDILAEVRPLLQRFEEEGLLGYEGNAGGEGNAGNAGNTGNAGNAGSEGRQLRIYQPGRPFLRLICGAFDMRMKLKAPAPLQFSRSI